MALTGVAGALASLAMAWQWGFVIAACTALVLLIAFGGVGTAMQLERARACHPDDALDGVRAVLRILIVFALVTPFWSLFDQKASTWIVQASSMTQPTFSLFGHAFAFVPAQMQALNPLLVMVLIPFNAPPAPAGAAAVPRRLPKASTGRGARSAGGPGPTTSPRPARQAKCRPP